ncbi:MAG: hypothetical protein BGP21_10515 [Thiobacillus sp. 65-29]|nr:MAG: hypothetical protein BGP21_10515 [Thiobacillus sp. 65-29]
MPASSRPMTDDELAAYDDLLQSISDRTDVPLSVELLDGFSAALIVAPRLVMPSEYFPVLLGDAERSVFEDEDMLRLFMESFTRRWNEIASGLDAPVENLADPRAYAPLILDWDAILKDLSAEDIAPLAEHGMPSYAQQWAAGFLLAVDYWEDDWALPENSKDEAYVDACLDPFYTLITPDAEWTADERELSREAHVANAIWSVYDLREFWRDRGLAPSEPIRKVATPGRNDPCPCGSGKKYKKCCGAET